MLVKQLKNRYNDPTELRRFVLGIDRAKMRLYDAEDSATEELFETQESSIEKDKFEGWDI